MKVPILFQYFKGKQGPLKGEYCQFYFLYLFVFVLQGRTRLISASRDLSEADCPRTRAEALCLNP